MHGCVCMYYTYRYYNTSIIQAHYPGASQRPTSEPELLFGCGGHLPQTTATGPRHLSHLAPATPHTRTPTMPTDQTIHRRCCCVPIAIAIAHSCCFTVAWVWHPQSLDAETKTSTAADSKNRQLEAHRARGHHRPNYTR